MKKLTALIVALSFVGMAAPAFAQSQQDEVPTDFIDIVDGLDIDGNIKVPGAESYDARDEAKFNPLFDAKRSFMPKIKSSARASALD
ncbi:hypothetical protein FIV42_11280 [Persicimonas caeni]|uniref:Uncharacterized protein n=1 Tax=Persicimonas caeni TaxID=2292766 RepID=A0A4Y6PSJ9_PERCE|nr:hypothetical protein [Persicimonas caeni]QDG51301.1 hypothetical protein FIV42_11280 [Persicimonas caeni]QED32522.1 hypothetical protein FRD00_11275 [Persicimonas caeni]